METSALSVRAPALHVFPSELESDPVLEVAQRVRRFLEPRFGDVGKKTTPSQGYCFDAAFLLSLVLEEEMPDSGWRCYEGYYLDEGGVEAMNAGKICRGSDLCLYAQAHGFLERASDGAVLDITADQFGEAEVVLLVQERDPEKVRTYWHRMHVLSEEWSGEMPLARAWHEEWKAERAGRTQGS